MRDERKKLIQEGIEDLLDSKTWKTWKNDLGFAVGYISSYIRQVSGKSLDGFEEGFAIAKLLEFCKTEDMCPQCGSAEDCTHRS